MIYEEAMKYISSIGKFGSNYGLKRTFRLLELLGNPDKKLKLIHVAGTNGKGSTTAMITKVLRGMGYKVGMYTSPYIEEFEERIQINGENIPKEKLVSLLVEVKEAVEKVIKEGYDHPTQFEILTALMFLYFYREKVDYGVVEVGLGGALDSTNVLTPIVSVITSISYDHMNILGDTIEEIAEQKAGIIKEGIPVVVYPEEKNVQDVIVKKTEEMNSRIRLVQKNSVKLLNINRDDIYQEVQVSTMKNDYKVKLPLLGAHQMLNLAVVLNTIEVIFEGQNEKLNVKLVEKSLEDVEWKGRLEVLNKKPLIVIDGAHNIDGIKSLTYNVNKYFKYKNMILLLGILADKQVDEMIKEIVPFAEKVYALTPHSDRAQLSQELKNKIVKYNKNVIAIESYEEAVSKAISEADEDDLILISGSLYMIGDMRKILVKILK
ncbi:folylpolyglutamate synthase/dihydrofolate synthase family protein [Clostridium sp. SM-530-WT-3G]|uniref:bifunctional folylpolyglutamate synthase/dihydrofolate synthase n=1 Tax=Clostridium sp. SM-530-WT-3G TaxID=2725303 RepID=UPI00145E2D7E|nr:folylpolyglutamate synthase/dihydrofolate synthase family protein [Clostridium sp. SM-530-WT-3G]NME83246.1 bifunctional folylpolyglutamate synthase/dihydrofolate synthase [Clostridium sp. SM-530-WT-3G]